MINPGPAHQARLQGVRALRDAGIAAPEHDAAELLGAVLDIPRAMLPMARELDQDQADSYAALLARRAAREPLQHILGSTGFFGLEIAVGPGVFIPRPETEVLVESALRSIETVTDPVVIDLCTGSGAIAVAIATRRPDAVVTAVELSERASGWLRRNVRRLTPQVEVLIGDALDESLALPTPADLVTCNPPYVPEGTAVDRETALHDPRAAVFAGEDGLALIRPLVPRIGRLLRPGGTIVLEHDESHQDDVLAIVAGSGMFQPPTAITDLTGRPRHVRAVRSPDRD
ncbi:peptide chain release factor N(5)-glutamine methyltransferase [Blastococcus sp. Marseille-P5729]|uniref:peptide chain release factor N(5)-glutamine methyltransferase n=1 Tax=Blastococcus sp. Marseille-P5729 TaxID=2086582 RepID=UPI0018FE3788|nr:peptide chain release factor N(5)-glutamine methyltransferase [Blastococcus sp. Marseille-P5729]